MVSGYTTLHRATEFGYPYDRTIKSLAKVCDEVIAVVTTETEDGTVQNIEALGLNTVRIVRVPLPDVPGWDGELKEFGRSMCQGDVVIQMDADEEFHPHSIFQARETARAPDWGVKCLGSIQFDFHGPDRIKLALKWRFFRNDGTWKHGIPPQDQGPNGTAIATDGCFPYDIASGKVLPFPVPEWASIGYWPVVLHTGGKDLAAKLRRNRDFIADQWDRLRAGGTSLEATCFGNVRGKTDKELEAMAAEWLAKEYPNTIPVPELLP